MPDLRQAIAGFEEQLSVRRDAALQLVALAEVAAGKGENLQAFHLAGKSLAAATKQPAIAHRARNLLRTLVPRYHLPMMNDARRNLAWSQALSRAVRPGSHVLEIGTGGGMLALMAARAGAARVITCEKNPIVAEVAREIAAKNGYSDCIHVIAKSSLDLVVGTDFDRPADLLFCDIFSDTLVGFDPLTLVADARKRLLVKHAPVVPQTGAIRVALGNWSGYERSCRIHHAAGFDVTPFAAFAPASVSLEIGDPRLRVLSTDQEVFHFDWGRGPLPPDGKAEVVVAAQIDCTVNGIVQWIRLHLDEETVLESKPEPGAVFFSAPRFHPFERPQQLAAGDPVRIAAEYQGRRLEIWRT